MDPHVDKAITEIFIATALSLPSISVQLILTLTQQSGDHSHFVGEETGPRGG